MIKFTARLLPTVVVKADIDEDHSIALAYEYDRTAEVLPLTTQEARLLGEHLQYLADKAEQQKDGFVVTQ